MAGHPVSFAIHGNAAANEQTRYCPMLKGCVH